MVFSSLTFLFSFLPLTLLLYFLAPRKYRNGVLFLVSLVFYAWGEPVYISLMLFSTVLDYTCSYLIDRYRHNRRVSRSALLTSVVVNLGLLGFFKYGDWLLSIFNNFTGLNIPAMGLALPIGISFYTFQTMSYTIDVYRGDAPVQKNIISLGAYVTLFPQLIAGPIVRYQTVAEQIDERTENVDLFGQGVKRFVVGLGKKVLLANNIGLLFDHVRDLAPGEFGVLGAWLGIVAFALQIYFDFSGYSDMAIGLGHMLGFNFLENFNYPYISQSIGEFWRRWHMSLGTWFRDYVYIPLGGSRQGVAKTYRNLILVWLLTGLWHGANWNFVLWGAYFAVFLVIERAGWLKILNSLPRFFRHAYTLVVVAFSWVLFAFEDGQQIIDFSKALLGIGTALTTPGDFYLLANYGLSLLILTLAATPWPSRLWEGLMERKKDTCWPELLHPLLTAVIFILATAYLVDASYNPFLYFRF